MWSQIQKLLQHILIKVLTLLLLSQKPLQKGFYGIHQLLPKLNFKCATFHHFLNHNLYCLAGLDLIYNFHERKIIHLYYIKVADGKIFHVIEDFQFYYSYRLLQYLLHQLYNICYSAAKTMEMIKKHSFFLHSGCKCKIRKYSFGLI